VVSEFSWQNWTVKASQLVSKRRTSASLIKLVLYCQQTILLKTYLVFDYFPRKNTSVFKATMWTTAWFMRKTLDTNEKQLNGLISVKSLKCTRKRLLSNTHGFVVRWVKRFLRIAWSRYEQPDWRLIRI